MSFKKKININKSPVAAAIWALALPGLGQIYNRDYIVGFTVLLGELVINVMANLNLAIFYAFTGDFQSSVEVIDYQWGLFYPSLYAYSIWNAYNRAQEINHQLALDGITPDETSTISKYTGGFFGFLLGMFFGIHLFHSLNPVFGGLFAGLVGGILGNRVEKYYISKVGYLKSRL